MEGEVERAPTGARDPAFLALALAVAAAGVCAFDLDPYLHHPAGALLALPPRRPLQIVQGIVITLACVLPLLRRRMGPSGSRAAAALMAALSLLLLLLATPFVRPRVHLTSVLLGMVAVLALAVFLLRSGSSGRNRRLEGVTTASIASCLAFLAGEAIATLLPATHAVGYTLASRAWFEEYWTPRNRRGYRDGERDAEPGRRIYVLGDSFAAGVGITNVEDRFSNILHKSLSPKFRVYNLGLNGSNTRDEMRRLLEQPYPPDLLIFSYYANDIQEACAESRPEMPAFTPYANLPPGVRGLVRRSYMLDSVYWRLPQADLGGYEGAIEACYEDRSILGSHLRDLHDITAYCRQGRIPLIVVAFPSLVRAEPSRRLIGPVIDFFEDNGVAVVDVFPLLQGLELRHRIVNRNDAHPSVELNRRVAEAVLSMLNSRGLLQEARAR